MLTFTYMQAYIHTYMCVERDCIRRERERERGLTTVVPTTAAVAAAQQSQGPQVESCQVKRFGSGAAAAKVVERPNAPTRWLLALPGRHKHATKNK